MKGNRTFTILYLLCSLIFIVVFNILASPSSSSITKQIPVMGLSEFLFIFLNNLAYTLAGFLLSFVGLSLIFIIKIPLIIAQGAHEAGINPVIYYFSSFTHGFCELLIGCILLSFTLSHINLLFHYAKGEVNRIHISSFYKKALKYLLPTVSMIILISAFLEVYVSNPLIKVLL